MGSKVLEASTLKAATGERAHQYERLREQFQTLKNEFAKIVDDSDFQGNGAESIKGFYQGQIDVVDAWIQLIDINVAFFKGIPGDTEDADLSGDTIVQVPFLEDYKLNIDLKGANGIAKSNPQFGKGGMEQIFMSDFNELIHNKYISRVDNAEIELHNVKITYEEYESMLNKIIIQKGDNLDY